MRPLPWLGPGWALLAATHGALTWGPAVAIVLVLRSVPAEIGVGLDLPVLGLATVAVGVIVAGVLATAGRALGSDPARAGVAAYVLAALAAATLLSPFLVVAGVPAMAGATSAWLGGPTREAGPRSRGARAAGYVGLVAIAATVLVDLVLLTRVLERTGA